MVNAGVGSNMLQPPPYPFEREYASQLPLPLQHVPILATCVQALHVSGEKALIPIPIDVFTRSGTGGFLHLASHKLRRGLCTIYLVLFVFVLRHLVSSWLVFKMWEMLLPTIMVEFALGTIDACWE